MNSNKRKRLPSNKVRFDLSTVLGINKLVDYTPVNSAHSAPSLSSRSDSVRDAHAAEARAAKVLLEMRAASIEAEWALHEDVLGARAQVVAQYGSDSPAVLMLGLKRKSERKRPGKRSNSAM
ncbi:MAG TPA: hypothetical protein PLO33_17415 [Kouleothrix sp.]|uniref:hypothetical protein n=1 Tax=Kouleothrix sp. TaxID=2779161 RepID=UPI002C45E862|nr:hypothetical protein [Kouleothrix sp.]